MITEAERNTDRQTDKQTEILRCYTAYLVAGGRGKEPRNEGGLLQLGKVRARASERSAAPQAPDAGLPLPELEDNKFVLF